MSTLHLLQAYARRIRTLRRANPGVSEPALAPAFQQLLEGLLANLPAAPPLIAVPEYDNPGVGRPDIALVREGAPPRAFVELKSPGKSSDPRLWRDHDRRQYGRFKELTCWAASNFFEIRLLHRDEETAFAVVVPEAALRADQDDARADRTIAAHDASPLLRLLERLAAGAARGVGARDAGHLAALLAHSARLVRGIIEARLAELRLENPAEHALLQVRQEFRDVLYAHPEVAGYPTADFDVLFSAAFAQTLAFGLLLVREATGEAAGPDAWRRMPAEHPLMRTALRVLSQDEVVQDIGIGFTVMRDTIDSFAPEILSVRKDGRDPILYFYEDFLQVFDPKGRERYGVYYTPIEVVRFMVGALDHALRGELSTGGLRDPAVTILDPATGTGTFLLGIAERVRSQVEADEEENDAMAALTLRDLAGRMFGFEMLIGPYAVAHYRLHHALSRAGRDGQEPLRLPRLGIYLADTLAEPGAAAAAGSLGFVAAGIQGERREANRLKAERPVFAIIGNPPYRRLEEGEDRTLLGRWMDELWDDLKAPVRDAGQGNQLNTFPELSAAFWRWAMWKMFEAENAPRRGVVAFITNRKFLTGWPYAGLRKMMRERFDLIDIIDLRGDARRGERAGVERDQGVFNIQVGTAITIAVAKGNKPAGVLGRVRYADSWAQDLLSRRSKLDWLSSFSSEGVIRARSTLDRAVLDDFRPMPFQNGEWVSLRDVFAFSKSGMKSGNDPIFVAVRRESLAEQIAPVIRMRADPAYRRELETSYFYRPLDKRWFFNDQSLLNRPGPRLQRVIGENNLVLYSLPSGTGAGPAVWCYDRIPDYHAFKGSYGGYAFPLHDCRLGVNVSNLVPALIEGLSAAYGEPVTADDTFDAVLALLSATSYAFRFAEDLEDAFPHVPFPSAHRVFVEAARLGRRIREVETFARPPGEAHRGGAFVRLLTQPTGALADVDLVDGEVVLCEDGSGRVTGIPPDVWTFAVSGYRLLPRWLEARVGVPADLAFVHEMRDICGRIAELIVLFSEADSVLETALNETLTREALGLDL